MAAEYLPHDPDLRPAVAAPVERPVRPAPPKRGTVDYAEWLADKLHNGGDYGKEAAALLVLQAKELARCGRDNCMGRQAKGMTTWVTWESREHAISQALRERQDIHAESSRILGRLASAVLAGADDATLGRLLREEAASRPNVAGKAPAAPADGRP